MKKHKFTKITLPSNAVFEIVDFLVKIGFEQPGAVGAGARRLASNMFKHIAIAQGICPDSAITPEKFAHWLKRQARVDIERRVELLRALKWLRRAFPEVES
jgi:hypothetical protein